MPRYTLSDPYHDFDSEEERALYGLPTAAILCVAVDTHFNIINFTGFCIRSIFN